MSGGAVTNADLCTDIATDSQGNAYWVGGVSNPAYFDCAAWPSVNTTTGFIAKVDPSGTCQWISPITILNYGVARVQGIAIDAEDRIYVTGIYDTNTSFGNGISLHAPSPEIFTARYTTEGECLWQGVLVV